MDFDVFTFTERERVAVLIGVTEVADRLAGLEGDRGRRTRKINVVERKREALHDIGVERSLRLDAHLRARLEGWDTSKRMLLLIELAAVDPFAPYQVEWLERDRATVLEEMAPVLGLPRARVNEVLARFRAMRKLHPRVPWMRVGVASLAVAALLAATGSLAAPAIGACVGSAAGLLGAAAVSHGLAILGGGSLAAGGFGMAGGMGLVASIGAASGLAGGALWGLSGPPNSTAFVSELIKLQVTVIEVILPSEFATLLSRKIFEQLVANSDALQGRIEDEKQLNDPDSERLNELAAMASALRRVVAWFQTLQSSKAA